MDTAVKTKEKEPTLPSHPSTTARELGGFFFAAVLAVGYQFLSWLDSFRGDCRKTGALPIGDNV